MTYLYRIYLKDKMPVAVFMVVIFVIGIISGSVAVSSMNQEINQNLFNYFTNFMQSFDSVEYEQAVFLNDVMKLNLFNLFIIWIFGISVILMPVIPVLIFLKGFVIGFSTAFLISNFSYRGIIISLFVILPQNLLIAPVYVLAGIGGISFSFKIINFYRGYTRLNFNDVFDYTFIMFLLGIILAIGVLIEVYISPNLFKLILNILY